MLNTISSPRLSRNARAISILLVEDDSTHADLFRATASSSLNLSEPITHAYSLREGLLLSENREYDLVVLDLGLPESDGLETLEAFVGQNDRLPIIILTALSDLETGEKALELGAMDFLGKDEVNRRALARSVRYSLERWKQKKALEESLNDLDRFGSAAAHDLVSPLNAIRGFTQLIEMGLDESSITPEIRECIDLLELSAKRAVKLVQDLHEFARIGRRSISAEPFALKDLVVEVEMSVSSLIKENDATLVVDDLPMVTADRGLVAHVLQNLISNGIKYRKASTAPVIRIECEERGREIVISVNDNGIGIDPKSSEKIFEAFQRLRHEQAVEGSGLGLSICKRIIEAHDGAIWVESALGEGSSFRFTLPR